MGKIAPTPEKVKNKHTAKELPITLSFKTTLIVMVARQFSLYWQENYHCQRAGEYSLIIYSVMVCWKGLIWYPGNTIGLFLHGMALDGSKNVVLSRNPPFPRDKLADFSFLKFWTVHLSLLWHIHFTTQELGLHESHYFSLKALSTLIPCCMTVYTQTIVFGLILCFKMIKFLTLWPRGELHKSLFSRLGSQTNSGSARMTSIKIQW